MRRSGNHHAGAQHRFAADVRPFDHDGPGADETVVLDDDGGRLHGFQHTAHAHAAAQVDALADLGAGADRRPRIDHCAGTDPGSDIDVGGHQDRPRRNVSSVAGHGVRHDPYAQLFVAVLEVHFVVPFELSGPHGAHLLHRKVEQNRLLDPLVDLPLAPRRIDGFGRSQASLVQFFDNGADRLPHTGLRKQCPVVPGLFDNLSQLIVHSCFSLSLFRFQSYKILLRIAGCRQLFRIFCEYMECSDNLCEQTCTIAPDFLYICLSKPFKY